MKFLMEDALKATESPDDAVEKRKKAEKKNTSLCLPICRKEVLASADEEEL